jgi:hypothetical protein
MSGQSKVAESTDAAAANATALPISNAPVVRRRVVVMSSSRYLYGVQL